MIDSSKFYPAIILRYMVYIKILFTLLKVEEKRKYAKWKAVDIDKCLKNGITPTPGPPGGDNSELGDFGMGLASGMGSGPSSSGMGTGPPAGGMGTGPPAGGVWLGYLGGDLNQPPGGSDLNPSSSGFDQNFNQPVPKPRSVVAPSEPPSLSSSSSSSKSGLTPVQLERVTKLCRYAISSLDYEDKDGAIENLTKALSLLKTGKE